MDKLVTIDPKATFEDVVSGSGENLKDEKGQDITVGSALKFAVANELKTDADGSQAEIVDRRIKHHSFLTDLHEAIKSHKFVQFTVDEAKYLEGRVAASFATVISGPLIKMLRGLHKLPVSVEKAPIHIDDQPK